jgi:hypothetical protein
MRDERGQASIEWIGAVVLVTLVLGGAMAGVGDVDGRSYGGWLAHTIVCSVRGGCAEERGALAAAYGDRDAELVRRFAPSLVYEPGTYTLPVDFRDCRSHLCSDAPDDRDLDAHRTTRGGHPATAFTHVVHRDGETFIQYWLYYPDSTSTVAGAAAAWRLARRLGRPRPPEYPGYHPDDWESVQVRIGRDGRVQTRASSHHGYQWCKQHRCKDTWGPWTGWSRVSRGSHAGHVPTRSDPLSTRVRPALPGVDTRERTTTGAGLRLVPIESVDTDAYRPLDPGITPPWRKKVYTDPLSDSTS